MWPSWLQYYSVKTSSSRLHKLFKSSSIPSYFEVLFLNVSSLSAKFKATSNATFVGPNASVFSVTSFICWSRNFSTSRMCSSPYGLEIEKRLPFMFIWYCLLSLFSKIISFFSILYSSCLKMWLKYYFSLVHIHRSWCEKL